MHRLVAIALVALAACSAQPPLDGTAAQVSPTSPGTASATTTPSTTETTMSAPPPTTTTTLPEPARALVTGSGVIAPIRAHTADGWLVGTPCAAEALVAEAVPIEGRVQVVIDPGHGGSESGAVGPNGLAEKDVNLDVARLLREWLAERDVRSVLTRDGDYRVAIRARAELITTLAPDLAVSIHHNAGEISPSPVIGATVFHQADDPESRRAAGLAYEEIVAGLGGLDLAWVASTPPGAVSAVRSRDLQDAYGILRLTRPVPTILSEPLFIQNRSEAEALATEEVQRLEVEALGTAIVRFLTTDDPGSGFLEPRIYTFPVSRTGGTAGCVDPDLEAVNR